MPDCGSGGPSRVRAGERTREGSGNLAVAWVKVGTERMAGDARHALDIKDALRRDAAKGPPGDGRLVHAEKASQVGHRQVAKRQEIGERSRHDRTVA